MPTTVMFLAAALAPAADPVEVKLEDLDRFGKQDLAALRAKLDTARFLRYYLSEGMDRADKMGDRPTLRAFQVEAARHHEVYWAHCYLYNLVTRDFDQNGKLDELIRLRTMIGDAAYAGGVMPPVCPPRCEKEFTAWLAQKRAAGFLTHQQYADHLEREKQKARQK